LEKYILHLKHRVLSFTRNLTCLFVLVSIATIYKLFLMPQKRKDSVATPVASGPKQKRSRTSFRTPTTVGLEDTAALASEVGSTKNRVVTLRSNASGRRGYRSQDLSAASSSTRSLDSSAADNSALPSDVSNTCDPIQLLDQESDTQPGSSAKSRPKQKNTTTVRYHWLISYKRYFSNEIIVKTY
jgi:hypothetical protein